MKKKVLNTLLMCLLFTAVLGQKPEGIIIKASVAPVIDGIVDDVWSEANVYNIDKNFQLDIPSLGEPGETTWQALWTDDGMYLLLQVTDDEYYPSWISGGANSWEFDKPEVYFDVNYVLLDGLGCQGNVNAGHYQFAPDMTEVNINGIPTSESSGMTYAFMVDAPNYLAEYYFPFDYFETNEGAPVDLAGQIGFDVTIIDRDPIDLVRKRSVWANVGAINESWVNMDDAGIIMFDGAEPTVYIEGITLTADGAITEDNQTLQINAEVLPENTTQKLKWIIKHENGGFCRATISKTGVVTPVINETVIVQAVSSDYFVYSNELTLSISGQIPKKEELNYIVNGNFEIINGDGTVPAPWQGNAYTADGVAILNNAVADPDPWGWTFNQVVKVPWEIRQEKFIYAFKMWADAPREVIVDFEDPANNYNRYGVSSDATATRNGGGKSDWLINITTEPTTYTLSSTFENMQPNTIQLMNFMLGWDTPVVYVDSIYLLSESDLALLAPRVKCNVQDSLALVAIYNATNGQNWGNKTNWLKGNVQTWYGVTMNVDGRVTGLNLASNRLNGYIPASIGNLTEMKKLVLGNNRYSTNYYGSNNLSQQPLPQTLENLTKLEILALDQLWINKELPDIFGGMVALRELYINYNYFSNQILPHGIASCSNLEILYIYYNNFYDLPDLTSLTKLTNLQAYGCYFAFDDIEPNLSIPGFSYSNQRLILGSPESLNPAPGETISRTLTAGGENNIYQWLKDGVELDGQTTNTLTLENVDTGDAGIYTLRVTNTFATQLILTSHPLILYQNQLPIYTALEALYYSTGGDNWYYNNNWLSNQPITTWYGIYIDNWNGLMYLSLYDNNLIGTLPEEFGDLNLFYYIEIGNNPGLTGEIPVSIGQLTNLQNLYLSNNNLTGNIPAEIANCSSLAYFYFYNNQISGLPSDLTAMNLYGVEAQNNKLEFDDVVQWMGKINDWFNYSPQKKYGEVEAKPLIIGGSVTFNGLAGGDGNIYQWYKNNEIISGQTGSELVLETLTVADEGTYECRVTNPAAPNLTLVSEPKSLFDATNLDAYEPDNYFAYAQEINGTDYQQHSLLPAGDRDIVWFEITQPSEVKIWMSNGEWGSRQLSIYAADTTNVLASGSDYATLFVIEPGIYYAKAWSQNSEVISEYFLDIEITPVSVDSYEPDNTWADAKQIYPFFPQDDHNLKPIGDADYVKFEISNAPVTVTVDVFNETLCRNFNLWLYDTDGISELAFSSSGAKNCGARIQYNVTSNGTYYVKTKVPWQEMYDYYTISVVTDGQPPVVPCNSQDSLALVAIYNATNGPNWGNKTNWLTGNVQTWYGVTMNVDGRVTGLNLAANRLYGYVPAEIGNLTEIKKLVLGNYRYRINYYSSNSLNMQPLPQTLSNLTKLEIFALDELYMYNELPDFFGGMTMLRELYINFNYFNNQTLPVGITSCANLEILYLQYNDFYNLPDLTGLSKLSNLQAYGCFFAFDDIESNLSIPGFSYSGQRLILGSPESLNPLPGETITRSLTVGGENNIYQWLKDGVELDGQTTNTLTLENVDNGDAGIYTLRVTNILATQLILASHPIILYQNQLPIYTALEALYNSTGGNNWINKTNWLSDNPITTWYGINVNNSNGLLYLSLHNNNLIGSLPQEFGDLSVFYQIQITYNPGLTGEIPSSIGQLANLQNLYLYNNKLSGTVPSTIGQLTNLRYLSLYNNSLTGDLPAEIGNMSNLYNFNIYNNQFESIPDEITYCSNLRYFQFNYNKISSLPNLAAMDYLYRVYAYNNKLEFDDVIPLMGQFSQFQYAPQDSIGESLVYNKTTGDNFSHSLLTGGNQNQYQWYKDGLLLGGQTSATIEITNLTLGDAGKYFCLVTNSQAPALTLYSRIIKLTVKEPVISCAILNFNTGWNIFALPFAPLKPELDTVVKPLITNTSLVKIQDENGLSLEDWGVYGGWLNKIADVSPTEGYKIKVNTNTSLQVCGLPVEYPYAIPLTNGWNIIGYPLIQAFDGLEVVQQLIDRGTLVKVQDEGGYSIEDWGIFGGWRNDIYDFIPGEGFKIKVNADDVLLIYESYPKSSVIAPEVVATKHFKPEFEGNGIDHMNINLVGLPLNIVNAGDELAVFDGTTCVGTVILLPHHLNSKTVSIVASASDNRGMQGFNEGSQITLKLWSSKNNIEYVLEPEIVKGPLTFTKHETIFASLEKYAVTGLDGIISNDFNEIKCYPNPFSEEITVEINLAFESEVTVEVLNQVGQSVKFVSTKQMLNSGLHKINWNGRNQNNSTVSPGIYHLRLTIGESVIHRKIVYSK